MMLLESMLTQMAQCQDHYQKQEQEVEGMPSSEEEASAASSQLDASRRSQMHCFRNSIVQHDYYYCRCNCCHEAHRPTPMVRNSDSRRLRSSPSRQLLSVCAFATNRRASSASHQHRSHLRCFRCHMSLAAAPHRPGTTTSRDQTKNVHTHAHTHTHISSSLSTMTPGARTHTHARVRAHRAN